MWDNFSLATMNERVVRDHEEREKKEEPSKRLMKRLTMNGLSDHAIECLLELDDDEFVIFVNAINRKLFGKNGKGKG